MGHLPDSGLLPAPGVSPFPPSPAAEMSLSVLLYGGRCWGSSARLPSPPPGPAFVHEGPKPPCALRGSGTGLRGVRGGSPQDTGVSLRVCVCLYPASTFTRRRGTWLREAAFGVAFVAFAVP